LEILNYAKNMNAEQINAIIKVLANECEIRGTDATGISYNKNDRLIVFKRHLPSHKIKFNIPQGINIVMGHTRLTTQGVEKCNFNNHPFMGNCNNAKYTLAHNGIIYNDEILREKYNLKNTHIQTDTYIAVQLIDKQKSLDFKSIANAVEELEGYFTFTILDDKNNLYIAKGESPLAIYHFKKYGFYVYASTEEILKKALCRLGLSKFKYTEIKLLQGDILKINNIGEMKLEKFIPNDYISISRYLYRSYSYDDYANNDKSITNNIECSYYNIIIEYAKSLGFTKDDIDILIEAGFEIDEIEDLLNSPKDLSRYISYYC